MKENEVRIGNYVSFENRIFQIDTIAKEFPTLNTSEFGVGVIGWNNLQPIELNENLIIKLGFIKVSNNQYLSYDYFFNNKMVFSILFSDGNYKVGYCEYPVNFIHQLQNIFFARLNREIFFCL